MAVVINTKHDFELVGRVGLKPTDRRPNDYLRMVSRIFASYKKEVNIVDSVYAYLGGFAASFEYNDDTGNYEITVEKGQAFVDDQFVAFTDDIVLLQKKDKLLANKEYYLVVYYQYIDQFNDIYPEIKFILKEYFNQDYMLKIGVFNTDSSKELSMEPQNLDNLYAQNFSKLLDVTSNYVKDGMDTLKYHYMKPEASDIYPDVKSGDVVAFNRVLNQYVKAKSCNKKIDKVAGIYLVKESGERMIIYSGIIDFGKDTFVLDSENNIFENLDVGEHYYLLDSCQEINELNDQNKSVKAGKIDARFFPGEVKIGYAVKHDVFMVDIDYSNEIQMKNIIDVVGDEEKFLDTFTNNYQYIFYRHAGNYLNNSLDINNDSLNKLSDKRSDNSEKINDLNNIASSSKTSYDGITIKEEEESLNANLNQIDTDIINYHFAKNLPTEITNQDIDNYNNMVEELKTRIQAISDSLDGNCYPDTKDDDGNCDEYTDVIKTLIQNIKNAASNTKTSLSNSSTYLYNFFVDKTDDYTNNRDLFLEKFEDNKVPSADDISNHLANIVSLISNENTKINDVSSYSSIIIKNYQLLMKEIYDDSYIDNYYTFTKPEIKYQYEDLTYSTSTSDDKTKDVVSVTSTDSDGNTVYVTKDYPEARFTGTDAENTHSSRKFTEIQIQGIVEKIINLLSEINSAYSQIQSSVSLALTYHDKILKIQDMNNNGELKELNTSSNVGTIKQYFKNEGDLLKIKTLYLGSYLNSLNLSKGISKSNSIIDEYISSLQNNNDKIIQEKNDADIKADDLEDTLKPTFYVREPQKSIFYINNYQRIIYNYTYLTYRIRQKIQERIHVESNIRLIDTEISEVNSQAVVNRTLINRLTELRNSYLLLKQTLDNEILGYVTEYNNIRVNNYGLEPIDHTVNDPNFNDGGYAQSDLECLKLND